MATELKLQPGWLNRDVNRATERVKNLEANKASKQRQDTHPGSAAPSRQDRMGALAPAITSLIDGYEADLVQHRAEINRLRGVLKKISYACDHYLEGAGEPEFSNYN